MMARTTSGRFSRFPAVNRDKSPAPREAISRPVFRGIDIDSMSVKEVLAWAGEDEDRRWWAYDQEAVSRRRKGILSELDPNLA